MIPVILQSEPPDFDTKVRKKGHNWLRSKKIALNAVPPKRIKFRNFWTHSNIQLWHAYSGICAYLAIYFEWDTGAASTDHFVAKSKNAGDAYEWNNYRLSCLGANRNKNKFDDVMDPIGLPPHTFFINFSSGEILPNPQLSTQDTILAHKTIRRIKLNSPTLKAMRANHYNNYLMGDCSLRFLAQKSPFVHAEIIRQGLQ
jgi:uncharacterized protein (TIGR02646 family)